MRNRERTTRKPQLLTGAAQVRAGRGGRMVGRGVEEGLLRLGAGQAWYEDLYYRAFTISWPRFLSVGVLVFLTVNVGFALLYLLQPGAVAGARPGDFGDAFFFSVQTLATIGYGQMWPATRYANLLMTTEVLLGIAMIAMVTGLAFARFSRLTARVLFSRVAVIGPINGEPTLSLRIANERRNQVVQAEVTLSLVRDEATTEGYFLRRFYDLKLARARTPIFAMTFVAMHPLDRDSPLYGATPQTLAAEQAEIVVTLTGIDATLSQTIHARASYLSDEILFNRRFADILGVTPDGCRAIDYARFHETVPV
ncbi:MAG TPA: ion channel [Stellaceae bacterium]|nr:ion channel [Stellaceae bacterium]